MHAAAIANEARVWRCYRRRIGMRESGTATEAELAAHARTHIHERAAVPKHLEIMTELPVTAIGKVFKPELRRRAIARVLDATLADLQRRRDRSTAMNANSCATK